MDRVRQSLLISSLLVILFAGTLTAQPTARWARSAGGADPEIANHVAVDPSGNSYVVGYFLGSTVDFGTGPLTNDSAGIEDIFIVKYNPSGTALWAKRAGGPEIDDAWGVAVDDSGNSYVVGYFESDTIDFGTGPLVNAGGGTGDVFVVKYDPSGTALWARGAGGNVSDQALAVAVDDSGNSYVAGWFTIAINFGTGLLTSAGGNDIFIVKYDPGGTALWAKSAGGAGASGDAAVGVAVDDSGNSYVTGVFADTAYFDTDTLISGGGVVDVFVAKYDPNGTTLWARGAGGTGSDVGLGIAVDGSGNSVVSGYFFSSTIDFGTGTLTNAGSNDIFIVKYDPGGTALWAKAAGGTSVDEADAVTMDGSGNSVISGRFSSDSIDFGTGSLTNASGTHLFVVKHDPDGTALWAKGPDGGDGNEARGIAVDTSGNTFVTGIFGLNDLVFGSDTLPSTGFSPNIFIAKLSMQEYREFSVQDRWNLVSVPLVMSDYSKTVLFPTAITSAFGYGGVYTVYDTLVNGEGYWIKFSNGATISHSGWERTEDTLDVAAGWNMVGSLSSSIPVSNVGSIPGGIVTSNFYEYDAGYIASTTIEPGNGYWVKVTAAGQLVMSSTVNMPASNRIRIQDTGELPPPPPDEVSSAVPEAYALEQNYPNPFNPVTTIDYALPVSEHVALSVFNMLGQEVAVLVDEQQEAGYKTVAFSADNLPSGMYTYRITAGTFTDVKKMLLLK